MEVATPAFPQEGVCINSLQSIAQVTHGYPMVVQWVQLFWKIKTISSVLSIILKSVEWDDLPVVFKSFSLLRYHRYIISTCNCNRIFHLTYIHKQFCFGTQCKAET